MSEDIHALSGAYAVDALDDVERARFERHLTGCSACRAEVESLVAAAVQLSVLTEVAPPPSLRARVLADIANVRPLPPLSVPEPATATRPTSHGGPVPDGPARRAGADRPHPRTRTAAPSEAHRRARPPPRPSPRSTTTAGHAAAPAASPRGWRVLVAAATVAVLAVSGFSIWRQVGSSPSKASPTRCSPPPTRRAPSSGWPVAARRPSSARARSARPSSSRPASRTRRLTRCCRCGCRTRPVT